MKKIIQFIVFIITWVILIPFRILPYRLCVFACRRFFGFAGLFLTKHKKIGLENLEFAFPEKTSEERMRIYKEHILHLGTIMAGFLKGPYINERFIKKYMLYDGNSLETENILNQSGTGVVLISGHIGSWEMEAQYVGKKLGCHGIYKKVRNPFIDQWVRSMRQHNHGPQMIPMENTNDVVKVLKDKKWLGFGSDQNAGKAGIFINFMNRPASTFVGPVFMAYRTGSRLCFYSTFALPGGKLLHRVHDLGYVKMDGFQEKQEMLRAYTERWVRLLEKDIRDFPEQYFWVHRRWRTKPGDFPGQT